VHKQIDAREVLHGRKRQPKLALPEPAHTRPVRVDGAPAGGDVKALDCAQTVVLPDIRQVVGDAEIGKTLVVALEDTTLQGPANAGWPPVNHHVREVRGARPSGQAPVERLTVDQVCAAVLGRPWEEDVARVQIAMNAGERSGVAATSDQRMDGRGTRGG
jgi:hypothetical protein